MTEAEWRAMWRTCAEWFDAGDHEKAHVGACWLVDVWARTPNRDALTPAPKMMPKRLARYIIERFHETKGPSRA